LKQEFGMLGTVQLLSEVPDRPARVLIIDRMGLLSRLYAFGDLAYIGGGFGQGIHNTLEAATWGVPVIFGPRYGQFLEAKAMIGRGAARSIADAKELQKVVDEWLSHPERRFKAGREAAAFVESQAGATGRIMSFLNHILDP
jgi:3-deoxy-D-manno-octulosonic-acid transferase